eukprot:NODE_704_length_4578_cov_0.780978.p4 type:complete len:132 gc:universal NODE_704_length_4578_cov_0.780978:3507-3902(+)
MIFSITLFASQASPKDRCHDLYLKFGCEQTKDANCETDAKDYCNKTTPKLPDDCKGNCHVLEGLAYYVCIENHKFQYKSNLPICKSKSNESECDTLGEIKARFYCRPLFGKSNSYNQCSGNTCFAKSYPNQ